MVQLDIRKFHISFLQIKCSRVGGGKRRDRQTEERQGPTRGECSKRGTDRAGTDASDDDDDDDETNDQVNN